MNGASITPSEYVKIQRDLDHTMVQLRTANDKLRHWDLDLTFNVEPQSGAQNNELCIHVNGKKPNGQGFNYVFNHSDLIYFKDDQHELYDALVTFIYEQMYKDQLLDMVTGPIAKAVQNIVAMST